uniref:Uncharacterized protein n=1 Tax=Micrurus lemniscatus lemniscatus TaxID=129467 RepID=A0A2D4IGA4_MICLE
MVFNFAVRGARTINSTQLNSTEHRRAATMGQYFAVSRAAPGTRSKHPTGLEFDTPGLEVNPALQYTKPKKKKEKKTSLTLRFQLEMIVLGGCRPVGRTGCWFLFTPTASSNNIP